MKKVVLRCNNNDIRMFLTIKKVDWKEIDEGRIELLVRDDEHLFVLGMGFAKYLWTE